jgi:hypothetical protein
MKRSRRSFLMGAGGTLLSLPFLESFGQTAAARPQRLMVVFTGEGTMPGMWSPTGTGSSFTLSPLLQPLTPYKNKLCVISGIHNAMGEQMGGNGHNRAGRSLLTAQPFSAGVGADNGHAAGPSVDQVIGGRIRGNTRFKSLTLNIGCDVGEYQMFYDAANSPVTGIADPKVAFSQLFSGFVPPSGGAGGGGGGTVAPPPPPPPPPALSLAERLRLQRKSVLDTTQGEYQRLMKQASASDKVRLDLHAAKVRELESSLIIPGTGGGAGGGSGGSGGAGGGGGGMQAPATSCKVPTTPTTAGNGCNASDEPALVSAHIKNAVMALACDITRVASIQFTNYDGPTFPWLNAGIPGAYSGWHQLIHRDGGNLPNRDAMAAAGFTWYATQVAQLLGALDAVDDGNGQTLLDNTLVLWISEFGDGSNHTLNNLPVVLGGGAGGHLKTNQHLQFTGKTTNDLFTTLLNIFGGTDTTFGYTSQFALNHGPLAGVAI